MFVGHLPAGYLLGFFSKASKPIMLGILLGSVLPDLDILWFYFVDGGRVHHHEYLTHRPAVWGSILILALLLRRHFWVGVGIGGVLHMCLDSIVGKIAWAWPISDRSFNLVEVPATQSHWILSFLLHWTFLVEIVLVACAALIFILTKRKKP